MTNHQRICERLNGLVETARVEFAPVAGRQKEPGFIGSMEERDLITQFVDHVDKRFVKPFLVWCSLRKRDAGAVGGGQGPLPRQAITI